MRLLALALLLAACGGSSTGTSSGDQTAIVVQVDYSTDGIDQLHVTGVALAHVRRFGPFDITDDHKVHSGATIALLFDPGDAGTAMICVEGRDNNGNTQASSCGMFPVVAGEVTHGELSLDGSR